jgi:hypothetical protein
MRAYHYAKAIATSITEDWRAAYAVSVYSRFSGSPVSERSGEYARLIASVMRTFDAGAFRTGCRPGRLRQIVQRIRHLVDDRFEVIDANHTHRAVRQLLQPRFEGLGLAVRQ